MTTRSSRSRSLFFALALALTAAGRARAAGEPTPADIESARALYVEGLELRDKGDLARSLQQFRAAQALAPTPITSLELARAHALLGQLLEAREIALSIERLPVRPEESLKAANARVEARAFADSLKKRIPSLRVKIVNPSGDSPPRVTVDGVVVPSEALDAARRLNPGKHVVVAEKGTTRATSEVVLAEGETRDLDLKLEPTGAPSPLTSTAPRGGENGPGPWFYAGLATTGLGVLVGSVTGAIAYATARNVDSQCIGIHCPPSASDDISRSKTMGNVSTVAFVLAGVAGVATVVLWLSQPSSATP
jgi:hypothetical protein